MSTDELIHEAVTIPAHEELIEYASAIVACHAGGLIAATAVTRTALMLCYALVHAQNGWRVFPTGRRNAPAIPNPHPDGSPERQTCKGECGLDGHGVHDATLDVARICAWWGGKYRGYNIGIRPPDHIFCLDNDPKKTGHAAALAALIAEHGPLPHTLMHLSGRLDGGAHRFYLRPPGKLSTKLLGPGFDIKDSAGYLVAPPSLHYATGKPYLTIDAPIADPGWLTDLIVVQPAPPVAPRMPSKFWANTGYSWSRKSPADRLTDYGSWHDVFASTGWTCRDADGDADGARWVHPTATAVHSATVRHGKLFVYSTNTPFDPTGTGDRNGYTRFRAYAILHFNGNESAAAASLRKGA